MLILFRLFSEIDEYPFKIKTLFFFLLQAIKTVSIFMKVKAPLLTSASMEPLNSERVYIINISIAAFRTIVFKIFFTLTFIQLKKLKSYSGTVSVLEFFNHYLPVFNPNWTEIVS